MSDFQFKDQQPVVVYNPALGYINGKIIGKATNSINEIYMVECTDGKLPTEEYPFTSFVSPASHIK